MTTRGDNLNIGLTVGVGPRIESRCAPINAQYIRALVADSLFSPPSPFLALSYSVDAVPTFISTWSTDKPSVSAATRSSMSRCFPAVEDAGMDTGIVSLGNSGWGRLVERYRRYVDKRFLRRHCDLLIVEQHLWSRLPATAPFIRRSMSRHRSSHRLRAYAPHRGMCI